MAAWVTFAMILLQKLAAWNGSDLWGMCLNSGGRFEYPPGFAIRMPRAHVYEVRPRRDRRGFDLISDASPFIDEVPYFSMIEMQDYDWDELGKLRNLHIQGADPEPRSSSYVRTT